MAEGDGGQFLGNRALEVAKIASACYHHPHATPNEMVFQMDAQFSCYGKNKFLLYVFLHPIVFWTARKMSLGCDVGLKMME